MAASTSTKKGCGCGCGGGGSSAPASPCKCGGASCSLCQDQGYVRPRFFAGQLLTEDDLQQLEGYGVAKNRLHMRQLFGAGVVCGLEITCYPCGGGKVMVNPGYALDCCGNDIVVSCSKELDINQMVRELLRKQRGGFDCGDPCADATKPPVSPNDPASTKQPVLGNKAGDLANPQPVNHSHKYCLYINYCEQASDPVSPYATDDPCGATSCETTRIREGFSFELRCPPVPTVPAGICGSIKDCLGDETAYATISSSNEKLGRYVEQYQTAYAALQKNPNHELEKDFYNNWSTHLTTYKSAFKNASDDPGNFIKASVDVAADLAAYAVQSSPVHLVTVKEATGEPADQIKQSQEAIKNAISIFKGSEFSDKVPDTLDLAYVQSFSEISERLLKTVTDRATQIANIEAGPVEPHGVAVADPNILLGPKSTASQDFFIQLLAYGAPYGTAFHNEAAVRLQASDVWIENRFAQSQSKTRCCMPELSQLPATTVGAVNRTQFAMFATAGGQRYNLFNSILKDCICNAINPPCPDCDDMGVPLACITMKDCKVVDICNLERTFVLTWPTMRYWIPEIGQLGNAVEKLCCPSQCEDDPSTIKGPIYRTTVKDPTASYAQLLLKLMTAGCGIRVPREPLQSGGIADNLRDNIVGAIHEFADARAAAVSESQGPGAQVSRPIEPNTVHEFSEKLKVAQQNFDQLSREHRKLLDRVAKLEKAVGKKGAHPDA